MFRHSEFPVHLLLNARDAARALAICQRTLYQLTAPRGPIPVIRLPGSGKARALRYAVKDLEDWIESLKAQNSASVAALARNSNGSITTDQVARRSAESPDLPYLSVQAPLNGSRTAATAKRKKASKQAQAGPSKPEVSKERREVSIANRRQSKPNREEERPNPFRLLLKEAGVNWDDVGPMTFGELRRIAGVDIASFHGWIYLGHEIPEQALDNLRRHFREHR